MKWYEEATGVKVDVEKMTPKMMTQNDKIRLHISVQVIAFTIASLFYYNLDSYREMSVMVYFTLAFIGHAIAMFEIEEPI